MKSELDKRIREVESLAAAGNPSEAVRGIEALIRENPDSSLVEYAKLRILAKYWNPHDALSCAKAYCKKYPREASGHELIAWIYLQNRNPRLALRHLGIADSIGGESESSTSLRIAALQSLGRKAEAQSLATSSSAATSFSLSNLLNSGALISRLTEAEMLQKVAQAEQTDDAPTLQASWLSEHGRFEEAEQVLEGALSLYPGSQRLLRLLADVKAQLGKEDQILSRMEAAFDHDPSSSSIMVWLNRYYRKKRLLSKRWRLGVRYVKAQLTAGLNTGT